MYRWTPFPFLRITLSFISGILLARVLTQFLGEISQSFLLTIAGASFFAYVVLLVWKNKIGHTLLGHGLLLILFWFGFLRIDSFSIKEQKNELNDHFSNTEAYLATVSSYPIQKDKYFVYEVQSSHVLFDSLTHKVQAKIQLYEKRGSLDMPSYAYGDKLLIQGNPFLIGTPKNPHEFDYASYMADQNIFFQQFPDRNDITKIASNIGNPLMAAVYRWRSKFESTLKSKILGPDEQAIALALLLGIKDYLDPEQKQAFSAAGAMHVLAVSGLHVGVIYMILMALFKPIKQRSFQQYYLPVFILFILWFYALLTGFSPSVFRAVTMFSVIIIGKILQRNSNIYNSLATSAFILLVINPLYLFSVGFQLSYLAVFGIVYFFDKLYQLVIPNTLLMDEIWKLTCVSIAAQIATAPISIYYFHQFPTYFIFSNLVVIPLSFIIMVFGLAILVFSQFDFSITLGVLLENVILLLNRCVDFIFRFEGSLIDWLYLTLSQTIFIYVAIVLFSAFLYYKRPYLIWTACLMLALMSTEGIFSIVQQAVKKEVIFYATRENLAMDINHGIKSQLFTLDSIQNMSLIKYQIAPYRLANHLPDIQASTVINSPQNLLGDYACAHVSDQKKYLYIFKKPPLEHLKLKTDFLIVSNNSFDSFSTLENHIEFTHLILAPSNASSVIRKMKDEAKKSNQSVVSLKDGAAIFSLIDGTLKVQ